jgi:hypothetical protein
MPPQPTVRAVAMTTSSSLSGCAGHWPRTNILCLFASCCMHACTHAHRTCSRNDLSHIRTCCMCQVLWTHFTRLKGGVALTRRPRGFRIRCEGRARCCSTPVRGMGRTHGQRLDHNRPGISRSVGDLSINCGFFFEPVFLSHWDFTPRGLVNGQICPTSRATFPLMRRIVSGSFRCLAHHCFARTKMTVRARGACLCSCMVACAGCMLVRACVSYSAHRRRSVFDMHRALLPYFAVSLAFTNPLFGSLQSANPLTVTATTTITNHCFRHRRHYRHCRWLHFVQLSPLAPPTTNMHRPPPPTSIAHFFHHQPPSSARTPLADRDPGVVLQARHVKWAHRGAHSWGHLPRTRRRRSIRLCHAGRPCPPRCRAQSPPVQVPDL